MWVVSSVIYGVSCCWVVGWFDGGGMVVAWLWWHDGYGFCGMGFRLVLGWSDGCGAVVAWWHGGCRLWVLSFGVDRRLW